MTEETRQPQVMVVDDTPENLRLLDRLLRERNYKVRTFLGAEQALRAASRDPPDLFLLDVAMPGMDGFELCARLKAEPDLSEIPVIFISALQATEDKVRAFRAGGVDYVTKPFEVEEVEARLKTHLALRDALKRLENSLARLQELEHLRDGLVHMIVHDMRSPLTGVLGNLDLLKWELRGKVDPECLGIIDDAMGEADRLERMANDLLDVSRSESGSMPVHIEECDVGDVVAAAALNVSAHESKRRLHLEIPSPLRARCDTDLVRRVVENLVSNGFRYTPTGQTLRVAASATEDDVCVTVEDQGPGIAPELVESIFDKFASLERTKRSRHRGIGLSLTFCKLAVEALGGQIGVDSKPERGASFWFTLPLGTEDT